MSGAPSVVYPVGRSFLRVALSVWIGLLLSGLVVLAWVHLTRGHALMLLLAVLAWCGWAGMGLWCPPRGLLRFHGMPRARPASGSAWSWASSMGADPSPLTGLAVTLDLQSGLLLCVHAAPGVPRWLWLDASLDPPHWPALRRALLAVENHRV